MLKAVFISGLIIVAGILFTTAELKDYQQEERIAQLEKSALYLNERCNELSTELQQVKRVHAQDYEIITKGWKE